MAGRYLTQRLAQELDIELMQSPGFSIDQLMELAGLSVACAVAAVFPVGSRILAIAGPGNNGGDALVAARHLFHFGYKPVVLYPKPIEKPLFINLVSQCNTLGINVFPTIPKTIESTEYDVVLDGIFGFSFDPSSGFRPPFDSLMSVMQSTKVPIVSIDIPSGWHVENGGGPNSITPHVLVSLTAPKLCAKSFQGIHFLGGRFLPPVLAQKYGITDLPKYSGVSQCVRMDTETSSCM